MYKISWFAISSMAAFGTVVANYCIDVLVQEVGMCRVFILIPRNS